MEFKVVSKESDLPPKLQGQLMHTDRGCHFKAILGEGKMLGYIAYTLHGKSCFIEFISARKRHQQTAGQQRELFAFKKQTGVFPGRYLLEDLVRHGVNEFRHGDLWPDFQRIIKRYSRVGLMNRASGNTITVTSLWRKTSNARRRLP